MYVLYYNLSTDNKKRGDKMSNKLGRPPKENSKKLRFEVRLNQEQADILNECADNLKISKTDVVIRGIELVKEKLDKNK